MKTDLRGGLSLLVFFIENAVENLCELLLVGKQHMKFLQVLGVVAPRYPDFQISYITILQKMLCITDCIQKSEMQHKKGQIVHAGI